MIKFYKIIQIRAVILVKIFDLKEFLLGDLDMIRQVEYGLLPADQQILEQQIDLASELFGEEAANRIYNDPDTTDQNFFERAVNLLGDAIYGTPLDQYLKDVKDVVSEEEYNEIKERVDSEPNLFDKLKELVKSGYEGIASPVGEALEAVGFTQQKYLGGTLQINALNLLGAAALGAPLGSILDFLGSGLAPTGQDLSNYLYDNNIDPNTANLSDVAVLLNDQGYDTPDYDPQTGEFITDDEVTSDVGDGGDGSDGSGGGGLIGGITDTISDIVGGDDTIVGNILDTDNESEGNNTPPDTSIIDILIDTGQGTIDNILGNVDDGNEDGEVDVGDLGGGSELGGSGVGGAGIGEVGGGGGDGGDNPLDIDINTIFDDPAYEGEIDNGGGNEGGNTPPVVFTSGGR